MIWPNSSKWNTRWNSHKSYKRIQKTHRMSLSTSLKHRQIFIRMTEKAIRRARNPGPQVKNVKNIQKNQANQSKPKSHYWWPFERSTNWRTRFIPWRKSSTCKFVWYRLSKLWTQTTRRVRDTRWSSSALTRQVLVSLTIIGCSIFYIDFNRQVKPGAQLRLYNCTLASFS